MTNTVTVSSRMSMSGLVRLTQTLTAATLSSTVYTVSTNATSNGSEGEYCLQVEKSFLSNEGEYRDGLELQKGRKQGVLNQ